MRHCVLIALGVVAFSPLGCGTHSSGQLGGTSTVPDGGGTDSGTGTSAKRGDASSGGTASGSDGSTDGGHGTGDAVTVDAAPESVAGLLISEPLHLSANTVAVGDTLTATATLYNPTSAPIALKQVTIAGRPPGGTNSGGPFDDFLEGPAVTVPALGSYVLNGSRSFASTDPTGSWYAYVSLEDSSGAFHDSTDNVSFKVTAKAGGSGAGSGTGTGSGSGSGGSGTTVFDCSSFASTGACGVGRSSFYLMGGGDPSLSGTRVFFTNPANANHVANSMIYQTRVNVQTFTASFTFVLNEWNLAFILENTNNVSGFDENIFQAGAGCEGGFYQAFSGSPPNNIFALEFDDRSSLTNENPYTILPPDSSVQIYQQDQSPCNPNDDQPNYVYKAKISTAPVTFLKPLVSPTNASVDYNPTGDTYSAKIAYDGSNVTVDLYDVTTGGSCPGSSCFTYTWTSVDIPSLVAGNTAYVGLTTGTSQPSSGSSIVTDVGPTNYPLYIDSFSYATGTP